MAKTGVDGLKRILNAAVYSKQGIVAAYRTEAAFRQELWLCLVLVPVAIHFGESLYEQLVLIASLIFILLVEIINSAIEAVVDRFGDDHHELSGRAKDMGSAAVLLAFIIAIMIWGAILL